MLMLREGKGVQSVHSRFYLNNIFDTFFVDMFSTVTAA